MGATQSDLVHAAADEAAPAAEATAADLPVVETAAPDEKKSESPEESSGSPPDSSAHASNPHSSSSPGDDKEHASEEGGASGDGGEEGGDNLVQESAEAEEAQEEEEEKPALTPEDVKNMKTAPFDIRFPSTNQTKHCYTRYIEYHKCRKEKGEDAPECEKYARYYRSLCPSEWILRWNEQREMGVFPGPY